MRVCQIRDVNSGTFGFVELALDKTTGQQVAIKFIDRGDKVRSCCTLAPTSKGTGLDCQCFSEQQGLYLLFDLVCNFPQLLNTCLGRVLQQVSAEGVPASDRASPGVYRSQSMCSGRY